MLWCISVGALVPASCFASGLPKAGLRSPWIRPVRGIFIHPPCPSSVLIMFGAVCFPTLHEFLFVSLLCTCALFSPPHNQFASVSCVPLFLAFLIFGLSSPAGPCCCSSPTLCVGFLCTLVHLLYLAEFRFPIPFFFLSYCLFFSPRLASHHHHLLFLSSVALCLSLYNPYIIIIIHEWLTPPPPPCFG